MKLTKEQKKELKVLKSMAIDANVLVATNKGFGITLAMYQDFKNAGTVKVASSLVSEKDLGKEKFSRKTGAYFALKRLFDGEVITMRSTGYGGYLQFFVDDLAQRLSGN